MGVNQGSSYIYISSGSIWKTIRLIIIGPLLTLITAFIFHLSNIYTVFYIISAVWALIAIIYGFLTSKTIELRNESLVIRGGFSETIVNYRDMTSMSIVPSLGYSDGYQVNTANNSYLIPIEFSKFQKFEETITSKANLELKEVGVPLSYPRPKRWGRREDAYQKTGLSDSFIYFFGNHSNINSKGFIVFFIIFMIFFAFFAYFALSSLN